MITRRQFLTRALAVVPAIAIGTELAELLAPQKTIFLPPQGGWGVRSTMELYRAYVESVRPVGVLVGLTRR